MTTTSPEGQQGALSLFEWIPKLIAGSAAFFYFVGFITVAANFSRYGISSYSVLQLQYLIAGFWAFGPFILLASFMFAYNRFEAAESKSKQAKYYWRLVIFGGVIYSIAQGVVVALLISIPVAWREMTFFTGIWWFSFFILFTFLFMLLFNSWRAPKEGGRHPVSRQNVPFYAVTLSFLIIGYAVWFGARIFPSIPTYLGGGRPLTVVFICGDKKLPDGIMRDENSSRSVPYKLLMVTDKSFLVISTREKERSIEFSRDAVQGMIVLKDE